MLDFVIHKSECIGVFLSVEHSGKTWLAIKIVLSFSVDGTVARLLISHPESTNKERH